jgi:hypothetical protein
MPIFRLSEDSEAAVRNEPETGMGFQIVFAQTNEGHSGRFLVLESLLLIPAERRDVLLDALQELAAVAADVDIEEVSGETVTFRIPPVVMETRLPNPAVDQNLPAAVASAYNQAPIFSKTALVLERRKSDPLAFVRFSARRRDPRVTLGSGDFAPGTYAVPWSELPMVPSGFAAVGRYALPNPFAARYAYPIVTSTTPHLIGAAAPNFAQAGGGVEVLFPQGAQALRGVPHQILHF